MFRFSAALLLLAAGTLPLVAQDRTPPAGSYDALSVPTERVAPVQPTAAAPLLQGRSNTIDPRPHRARRLAH